MDDSGFIRIGNHLIRTAKIEGATFDEAAGDSPARLAIYTLNQGPIEFEGKAAEEAWKHLARALAG